jgi:hypothetical protein
MRTRKARKRGEELRKARKLLAPKYVATDYASTPAGLFPPGLVVNRDLSLRRADGAGKKRRRGIENRKTTQATKQLGTTKKTSGHKPSHDHQWPFILPARPGFLVRSRNRD